MADTIIIRAARRGNMVELWSVVRERDGKRPSILAGIYGNGPLSRRMAVKTALAFMLELMIEDLHLDPSDWAEEMAAYAEHLTTLAKGMTAPAERH